jgi:hypothetical protein
MIDGITIMHVLLLLSSNKTSFSVPLGLGGASNGECY